MRDAKYLLLAYVLLAASCAPPPPPPEAPKAPPPKAAADEADNNPGTEAEIGALDEIRVKKSFEGATQALFGCFTKGSERIGFLAGEVSFKLRITRTGGVRWVFVKDSTLGDRETEACMTEVLKSAVWPKPVGGEGIAESTYTFEPGNGAPQPVAWTPAQLGPAFGKAKGDLKRCLKNANTGALKATLYVDPSGKASSVGVAASDERAEAAIACVVGKLTTLKFPSPGSNSSKVSVTIE